MDKSALEELRQDIIDAAIELVEHPMRNKKKIVNLTSTCRLRATSCWGVMDAELERATH